MSRLLPSSVITVLVDTLQGVRDFLIDAEYWVYRLFVLVVDDPEDDGGGDGGGEAVEDVEWRNAA